VAIQLAKQNGAATNEKVIQLAKEFNIKMDE